MGPGPLASAWYKLLCRLGLHGVKRVENGHACHACYQLRWKRGVSPRAAGK